jgi:hypothetical protein
MAQVHYAGLTRPDPTGEFGRWSVPGEVDFREWDGEFVVRVGSTAQTYLLSSLAGEALKAMQGGACYVHEIAAQVFFGCEPANAATAALVATFADNANDDKGLLGVLSDLEALRLARVDLT